MAFLRRKAGCLLRGLLFFDSVKYEIAGDGLTGFNRVGVNPASFKQYIA